MNTTNQSSPAVFSAETSSAISLGELNQQPEHTDELLTPARFRLPSEDDFDRRGIPESALHD
jgi:hypothetical protein